MKRKTEKAAPKKPVKAKAAPSAKVTDATAKRLSNLKPFKSGSEWTGNSKGRPKGSRNQLTEEFIAELHADFIENGSDVIRQVRVESPKDYLKVIGGVISKELIVKSETIKDMSDDELLGILAAIRSLEAPSGEGDRSKRTRPAKRDQSAGRQLN